MLGTPQSCMFPIFVKMGLDQSSSLTIVTIFLLCLSSVIILLRCATRLSIEYFGLDDWLMFIGQARCLPTMSC
ncbi:hypothetical protein BKA56DRAFT_189538 [Ilyonectria sp. MPI-CAGE-AT-0026]|nr:hypothetical protein BKA56DRAFT_189538 [Ilyonectria sp. MPI-CAGE-AT-0026]